MEGDAEKSRQNKDVEKDTCPSLPLSVSLRPPSFFSPSLLAAVPKWAGGPRQTQHRAEQRAIQRLAN